MSRVLAPSTNRPYGAAMVSRLWRIARATVSRHRSPAAEPRRPGPIGPMPDDELVDAIRDLLAQGDRKIWARLRFAGIRTPKRRVLRLTGSTGCRRQAGSAIRVARGRTTARSGPSGST